MDRDAAGTSDAGSRAGGDASAAIRRRNTRRPKYSKFTQQELPACKPILTPKLVVSLFFGVGIVFVSLGLVALLAAHNVVEIVERYDDACVPPTNIDNKIGYIQDVTVPKDCIRILTVTKDMKQPIFVYYQLDSFYQNHRRTRGQGSVHTIQLQHFAVFRTRGQGSVHTIQLQHFAVFRYVLSRNDAQLRDPKNANQTTSCDPEKMANGKPIIPCGLIAWSLFNDTYSFSRGNETLTVDKKGISWKSDREHKFGQNVYPSNFQNGALIGGKMLNASIPLSEQEDLIVWMRTAALPTFRKLYGKIYVDLKVKDKIIVKLINNYNTYSFGGKKTLILSTATWLGGKNYFLGYAYLVVGGLCIFLGFAFSLLYTIKPRKLGDQNYMSWNN